MNVELAHPWALLLLPLSLVPLLLHGQKPLVFSSLDLIPADPVSRLLSVGLRVAGALTIGSLVIAISGPFLSAQEVERTGQGAQMVLLLDRSRSMDQPFFGSGSVQHPLGAGAHSESKGSIARRLLSEFVASRKNDLFSMVVFSTNPIQVLPLTQKQSAVQAAIEAGNVGKGLAETNIGGGLLKAMQFFEGKPYTGSRIVVLISDGAATLSWSTQHRIKRMMKRSRVALYWIYIRTKNSVGLFERIQDTSLAPQQALHQFFVQAQVPYRVYTAENPEELKRAIADVSRLQNLPIVYKELIPRRDLSEAFYAISLLTLGLLVLAKFGEVNAW